MCSNSNAFISAMAKYYVHIYLNLQSFEVVFCLFSLSYEVEW